MSPNLTLWGRKNSCNVQKTLWTIEELGLPYRHEPVGGSYGGLDNPAYRALNPNGVVPTLQDGDLTVWESHATVRYLAAAYGGMRFGAPIRANAPLSINGRTGPRPPSSPAGSICSGYWCARPKPSTTRQPLRRHIPVRWRPCGYWKPTW
ncbi:glutathione S-transferase N-terminal domain-containing protein [Devosia sp. A8/3-2]|nr:glutathione S-transferase N-terminal domain-containing protein [Devosia sp. A8/3-2]